MRGAGRNNQELAGANRCASRKSRSATGERAETGGETREKTMGRGVRQSEIESKGKAVRLREARK